MYVDDFIRAKRLYDATPNYTKHKGTTFRDQKIGVPFTVYVVFESICGLLREYKCVITPHKIFGIKITNAFRIRIYRGDEDYCFVLHDKVHYNCDVMFDMSVLFLQGDGSDIRYTHGSYKCVYLDEGDAIEQAKVYNAGAYNDARHGKDEIERFQIDKRKGDIRVEIDGKNYTIILNKNDFSIYEIPNALFSYDDCKAYNGVVVQYKMVELIRKYLKERNEEK